MGIEDRLAKLERTVGAIADAAVCEELDLWAVESALHEAEAYAVQKQHNTDVTLSTVRSQVEYLLRHYRVIPRNEY